MVKKFLTIMFASVMAMLAFTAYSNDDEPQGPFGEKMLENIDKIIVDQADAGNLYQKKDDAARFILVADSKEAAHGVCEKFILDQWDVPVISRKLQTSVSALRRTRIILVISYTLSVGYVELSIPMISQRQVRLISII